MLRGTAMPEDRIMAQNQLGAGLARLNRNPIGRMEAESLGRIAGGGCAVEDHVLARRALNNILNPFLR